MWGPKLSVAAFSLVEVVLALSVMAFACITLIGLMTGGLQSVHQATLTTVQAHIMQSIVNSAEIQSYNNGVFTNSAGTSPASFYFDDEGTPLQGNPPGAYAYLATVSSEALYLPGGAGIPSSTPVAQTTSAGVPGSAALLKVIITAKSNPTFQAVNTVVWPNTAGNGT